MPRARRGVRRGRHDPCSTTGSRCPAEWTGGAVALGNFDGVHRGHQALLAGAAEQARRARRAAGRAHLRAASAPLLRARHRPVPAHPATRQGCACSTQHGVQAVLAQRFDPAFAAVTAQAFVDGVLLKGWARAMSCAATTSPSAPGAAAMSSGCASWAAEARLGVTVLDPVTHEGEIYSSTRIREALRAGWLSEASELLGHPWEIEGAVEQGDQRGRTIGFPDGQRRAGRASAAALRRLCRACAWSMARGCNGRRQPRQAARPSASSRRISRSTCSTSRATSTARPLRVGADRFHPAQR